MFYCSDCFKITITLWIVHGTAVLSLKFWDINFRHILLFMALHAENLFFSLENTIFFYFLILNPFVNMGREGMLVKQSCKKDPSMHLIWRQQKANCIMLISIEHQVPVNGTYNKILIIWIYSLPWMCGLNLFVLIL